MAVILNKPKSRMGKAYAKLFPLTGDGPPVVFWAENGMVRCRDERPQTPEPNRYRSVPWKDMALRVLVYSQMIKGHQWGDERQRAQLWICEMEDVLREAAEQAEDPAGHKGLRRVAEDEDRPMPAARPRSGDRDLEANGLTSKAKLVLPDKDFKF